MKKFILWTLAFVITVVAAVYQRHTGPTYPKEISVNLNSKTYSLKLVRSIALNERSEIRLDIKDTTIKARLYFKHFNSKEDYQSSDFKFRSEPKKEGFFAEIPQQPAAGKLQYYFEIDDSGGTKAYLKDSPVVVRYKGGVPLYILLPHILCMFIAMLFSTLAGLMAVIKYPLYKKYGILTLILFAIGGMILGPVVQYYAFGDFWTGIPFGWDLTDNKTLIALVFWILAVVMNRKKERPMYTVLAAFILLLVFSIPHSLFGSQLDYSTGHVIQGVILNFF
jgi:hypothetical protein